MADCMTEERYALTSGSSTISRDFPAVSPDGQALVFTEGTGNYDVASVELQNAHAHRLIATERNEMMPGRAANQPVLVYVSDRNGPNEIWLHRPESPGAACGMARDFPDLYSMVHGTSDFRRR